MFQKCFKNDVENIISLFADFVVKYNIQYINFNILTIYFT